jgi:hypothetical protein
MRKYDVLHSVVIDKDEDWIDKVELCWVSEMNEPQIRICYYTKQKRNGTEFWNIAPRPLSFNFDSAEKITNAIKECIHLYNKINRK